MAEGPARPDNSELRTELFAREVRTWGKCVPLTLANREDLRQLVKSSGPVGANDIEANGALSPKDFVMRVKISRKEAKETAFWLRLIDVGSEPSVRSERDRLEQEARELVCILSAITQKTKPD